MAMGGAETLVYNMVKHSSFATHKPVICCLKPVGYFGEKLKEEGYVVYNYSSCAGLECGRVNCGLCF